MKQWFASLVVDEWRGFSRRVFDVSAGWAVEGLMFIVLSVIIITISKYSCHVKALVSSCCRNGMALHKRLPGVEGAVVGEVPGRSVRAYTAGCGSAHGRNRRGEVM